MEESDYFGGLNGLARARYQEKVLKYIGYDPYTLKKNDFSVNLSDLPPVTAMDITSYLVLQTSFYTAEQMKAFKSLDAYNYFICGWVNTWGTREALNNCQLVFGRVSCLIFFVVMLGGV